MRQNEEKEVKRDDKGRFLEGSNHSRGHGAGPNNKSAQILHTIEEQQAAYKAYCAHIAKGFHKKSFSYRHPKDILLTITWETMENYIKRSPSDFPTILMQDALSQSMLYWEAEGQKIMKGQYKTSSPVTWACFMRNKFGWDKQDPSLDNTTQAIVIQQGRDIRAYKDED